MRVSQRMNAEAIISDAEAKAENMIQRAKVKAEENSRQLEQQAEQQGYNEGYTKGETEAQALIDEANGLLEQARYEHQTAIDDLEPKAVHLIMEITRKLIGAAVDINENVILFLVRQGMAQTQATEFVTVRVSPDDLETVTEHSAELSRYVNSATKFSITSDVKLSKGDCVIDTGLGSVDSGVNQQLETLLLDLRMIFDEEGNDAHD